MNHSKAAFDLRVASRADCPVCGCPLDRFEQALAENDANFQCRHCWTRIGHGNGNGHGKKLHAVHNGGRRRQ